MTITTLRDNTFLAGSAMAAGTTKLLVLPSVWIFPPDPPPCQIRRCPAPDGLAAGEEGRELGSRDEDEAVGMGRESEGGV